MTAFTYPLLKNINYPNELRQLDAALLPKLAQEIRHYLIETLNQCGGHFAGNLGIVELTVALHYIYETPHDRLVWDIGHQTYPHKILTGRREQLHTIRQTHGLAPFLRRDESDYDNFGAGHSSTSISAALGMALAAHQQDIDRQCVAIIGDGAMSAGMVFEALNHAGSLHANLLVILNDNDMSISPPVGALSNYFSRTLSSKLYTSFRKGSKKILQRVPPMLEFAKRTEEHIKGMVAPGTLFEELGFNYLGPFDGHDVAELLRVLSNVKMLDGPQFLHIVTKKGKGYSPAEMDPESYHAVKPGFYNHDQTKEKKSVVPPKQLTYSNIFGQCLCDMASIEPKLVAITPAMLGGSGLIEFSKRFPERCFDVGIAEQHALTLAAGMAADGLKPVVAIYSTFLQRAYDQLIHDIAIQNLPVIFAIDRSGIVGGDGVTHHGAYDLAFLRCLPNLIIMAPANENETRQMLYTAMHQSCPTAIRYPRGTGPGMSVQSNFSAYAIGKANIERQGEKIALLAFGSMLTSALKVANKLNATVVNMRFVKPLDTQLINTIAEQHSLIFTLEEAVLQGGAGSAVNQYLATQQITTPVLNLGLPDTLIQHGDPKALLAEIGLDAQGILQSIQHYQELI